MRFAFLLIAALWVLILSGCASGQDSIAPVAVKGILDLRTVNLEDRAIALDGEWEFSSLTDSNSKEFRAVPGNWNLPQNTPTTGEYRIKILLPHLKTPLCIKAKGVSTAGEIWWNGKLIGSIGKIGNSAETSIPSYHDNCFLVLDTSSVVVMKIKVSNFHHYKGGLLQSIFLINQQQLSQKQKNDSITGGMLLGVCMISALIYFALYFFMPGKWYFLTYAAYTSIIFIHMLCLTDRWLYSFLGETNWIWAYKIELMTVFLGLAGKILFYNSFFKELMPRRLLWSVCGALAGQAFLVVVLPAPWFTYFDFIIPINLLGVLIFVLIILIRANKMQLEGSSIIAFFNIFLLTILVHENFFINKSIHGLELLHFYVAFYVAGISLVLLRRIAHVFASEHALSMEIKNANEKLEKQNKNLEEIVSRRTAQLIEAEKESHQLQLEKKERDLSMLAATNQMKFQFTKNLIEELSALPKNEKELKIALQGLIAKLKGQASVEERLEVLQKDMDRINAEFYDRLITQFPDLSKTERELCAYIKLNLSNKDIAELRKTSLNTINVTRSRLRKKLGLTRDEELEIFIQQF